MKSKHKPIALSVAELDAIREADGDLVRLQRPIRPQPADWKWHEPVHCAWYAPTKVDKHGIEYPGEQVFGFADEEEGWVCPFGAPGDLLWVRETWNIYDFVGGEAGYPLRVIPKARPTRACVIFAADSTDGPWRAPLSMPKWASRLTLEIEDVAVHRIGQGDKPWVWVLSARPWWCNVRVLLRRRLKVTGT